MKVIWHGTASVEMISLKGDRILFDPFVPLKGSDVPVKIEDFDGFDEILITHGHFDHIISLPEIVRRNPGIRIRCTETPYKTLLKKGVPEENLILIRHGDTIRIGSFTIKAIHGKHAVLPKASVSRISYILRSPVIGNVFFFLRQHHICKENGETVFYEVECDGKRVCVMGSLNLREDTEYPTEADLLILPYNGWEDNFPPAVQTVERLKPKRILLDHYDDTFPPLTMPLDLSPILEKYRGIVSAMELGKTEEI